ncbi:hypothetical protein D3C71_1814770 [compost metagenome]
MAARILHQLRGRVKAHGQRVEQRRQKACGFVALEPTAGISEQRKAVGMAFRKAVFPKTQHLLKDGLRKLQAIATCQHALDQGFFKPVHAPLALPGGH